MEPTLDIALEKIFGEGSRQPRPPTATEDDAGIIDERPDDSIGVSGTVQELAEKAREYYDRANERLQSGDWAGYGENIEKLNNVLKQIEESVTE